MAYVYISDAASSVSEQSAFVGTYHSDVVSIAPNPAAWAMMLGGLGMLVVVQRMRRKRA